jgi:hypothetical protein
MNDDDNTLDPAAVAVPVTDREARRAAVATGLHRPTGLALPPAAFLVRLRGMSRPMCGGCADA